MSNENELAAPSRETHRQEQPALSLTGIVLEDGRLRLQVPDFAIRKGEIIGLFLKEFVPRDMSPEDTVRAIHELNPAESLAWRRFAVWVREVYEAASEPFMRRPFGDLAGMTGAAGKAMLRQLPSVLSPRSLDGVAGRYFADPRLRQLIGRFATYNGSTPFRAPATFAIIAHVEHALGAFHPIGGIRRIADAEVALAGRLGVELTLNAPVTEVVLRDRQAIGVRLASGDVIEADAVLVNADATTAWERLMPPDADPWTRRRLVRAEPSTSALVMVLGLRGPAPQLAHHNVAFSANYREEFADLTERRKPADDPTVYVCASSRTDASQAPPGGEALFVMVNLPALTGAEDREALIAHQRERIFSRLASAGLGVDGRDIVHESYVTPSDFASRDGSRDGSLYGPASNSRLPKPRTTRCIAAVRRASGISWISCPSWPAPN